MEIFCGTLIIFIVALAWFYFDNRAMYQQTVTTLLQEQNLKVLCMNCVRVYGYERKQYVDQCEIPACGLRKDGIPDNSEYLITNFDIAVTGSPRFQELNYDPHGIDFIKKHLNHICFDGDYKIYGHPSQLNINHDCYFFKPESLAPKNLSLKERLKIFFNMAKVS